MTSPADELRTAAEKLRKLASDATPAPWTWNRWHSDTCPTGCDDPSCFLLIVGSPYGPVGDADVDRDVFAVERSVQERGESDAAFIAAMDPTVGLALADWLDTAAANAAVLTWPNDFIERALAVARAINGGAS
ncbi:hypothetical protein GCM10009837_06950 [Streptomyces durmitorensis]|uniref:Uncharacterized protein n=1 Tax=Streptomyces durmitorensis TaxID=319947 RepID=A0ABY4PM84_9ACTN|nr:hypothetical protein [Streptomyces durmitorensis]UQT54409.1 hypothetical protein M4V62_04505 [Streptomyces durmitorensis]